MRVSMAQTSLKVQFRWTATKQNGYTFRRDNSLKMYVSLLPLLRRGLFLKERVSLVQNDGSPTKCIQSDIHVDRSFHSMLGRNNCKFTSNIRIFRPVQKQCRPSSKEQFDPGLHYFSFQQEFKTNHQAHGVYTTSYKRRCNVTTLHRRWCDVVKTWFVFWAGRVKILGNYGNKLVARILKGIKYTCRIFASFTRETTIVLFQFASLNTKFLLKRDLF